MDAATLSVRNARHRPATNRRRARSSLASLPTEIRLQIYHYVFSFDKAGSPLSAARIPEVPVAPGYGDTRSYYELDWPYSALLRTCRKIRSEALAFAIERTTFVYNDINWLTSSFGPCYGPSSICYFTAGAFPTVRYLSVVEQWYHAAQNLESIAKRQYPESICRRFVFPLEEIRLSTKLINTQTKPWNLRRWRKHCLVDYHSGILTTTVAALKYCKRVVWDLEMSLNDDASREPHVRAELEEHCKRAGVRMVLEFLEEGRDAWVPTFVSRQEGTMNTTENPSS